MFIYTLGLAIFLLIISVFAKKFMIYMALAIAWLGVIWVTASMSGQMDMSDSLAIQIVAVVIAIWAMTQMFRIRRGDDI